MRAHAAYFGVRLGKSTEAYTELVPNAGHLRASGDPFAASYALWYLGMVCWAVGKFAEANDSLQAGVDKARACGARVLWNRPRWGVACRRRGDGRLRLPKHAIGLRTRP